MGFRARVVLPAVLVIAVFPVGAPNQLASAQPEAAKVVSVRDGLWSNPGTWGTMRVPGPGSAVTIAAGTTVLYEVASEHELGSIDIEGTLTFSRARSTRLDVGNIFVRSGGLLDMGDSSRPIPTGVTAEIRLVVPEGSRFAGGGFVEGDVGLWVLEGGRWQVHGSPVRRSWVKLARPAHPGDASVFVRDDVSDWPSAGDVVITSTNMQPASEDFEERKVAAIRRTAEGLAVLHLDRPLGRKHDGGLEMAGEVALLSRNVRIVSKYPTRTKSHTAYMHGAAGRIAFAEFKDLGALGILGRYPIHFHMMGDSSKGMSVRGVSIWRSDNHFVNIHASSGITIADSVGYDAAGSGFFIEPTTSEEGTEPQAQGPSGERARTERRRAGRQPRRSRLLPPENVNNVFMGNLAAKGFWRPGSLDDPNVALFWIASLNTVMIGNVATGSRGGKNNTGFRISGPSASSDGLPLAMVRNEAHSNGNHGFLFWMNSKLVADLVELKAWRNGRTGLFLGAYTHRLRAYRADLQENGESNASIWVVDAWIQDSVLRGAPIGIFFARHSVIADPDNPTHVIRTRFSEHRVADVSQDHQPCSNPEAERSTTVRGCPPNYAVFHQPDFRSEHPIDFGWHANANSWIDVLGWSRPRYGLSGDFRIIRSDRTEGTPVLGFGGRVNTIQRKWDAPPVISLTRSVSRGNDFIVEAMADDDHGITAVEFLIDGMTIKRLNAPPFVLSLGGAQIRRGATLYARAVDTSGQPAYSAVVRLASLLR